MQLQRFVFRWAPSNVHLNMPNIPPLRSYFINRFVRVWRSVTHQIRLYLRLPKDKLKAIEFWKTANRKLDLHSILSPADVLGSPKK